MTQPSDFEQVLWNDWINGWWIETISLREPMLFIRATKSKHSFDDKQSYQGDVIVTGFVEGSDGFAYKLVRNPVTSKISQEPIYTLKGN